VQQSGGFVTVQSEVGRGSTFFVHLPCVTESVKPVETFRGEERYHGSGKILLVEDETALRELAGRMLTEAGYIVASTGDGGEALRLSRTELESIDLLITDMVMPGMSGPDLAAHLLKRLPKLEVLYISGYADHPLIEAGALSDRETLLRKPFTHDQLLMTVQKIRGGGADRRLTA
jgi:CheY-like chemotaxis protein